MQELLNQLNSFEPTTRQKAIAELLKQKLPNIRENENVNMHFHSFNSYNCEGWSPTRIAYESKVRGLFAAGIIDFDVIDGGAEFMEVSEMLGLRASVGIETRAFLTEYSHLEIDSPGEPGVSYISGSGFVSPLTEGSLQAKTLAYYRNTANERNIALIARINAQMPAIAIDYIADVLPLTPAGNATERHIIQAYIKKSISENSKSDKLYRLWSEILGRTEAETEHCFQNMPQLEDLVRAKLAKKGGVGYEQPTSNTFPKVEDFFAWIRSCGAIPLESWLDGTSKGEEDGNALLELSSSKGAAGLNIIPDRNWNIKDADTKAKKYKKLEEIVKIATEMDFPLHIGTEMNKLGLPFADDLNGADLQPFKQHFITGAKIFVGHSVLQRFASFAYCAPETEAYFKNNIKNKNKFFESVGALPAITAEIATQLRNIGAEKSFAKINDAIKNGKW